MNPSLQHLKVLRNKLSYLLLSITYNSTLFITVTFTETFLCIMANCVYQPQKFKT